MARVSVHAKVSYRPYGECTEGLDYDGNPIEGATVCGHTWPSSAWSREQMKDHVKTTGHKVRAVEETVTLYGRDD